MMEIWMTRFQSIVEFLIPLRNRCDGFLHVNSLLSFSSTFLCSLSLAATCCHCVKYGWLGNNPKEKWTCQRLFNMKIDNELNEKRCVAPELKMGLKTREKTSIKVNDTQKIHKAMIQIVQRLMRDTMMIEMASRQQSVESALVRLWWKMC